MPLVSSTLNNLLNGINQQDWTYRMPNQGEAQVNLLSSPVEGVMRRPATVHLAKILDEYDDDMFSHWVNRDSSHRYTVVIMNGDLKVFDLAGNEKSVSFPNGREYLFTKGGQSKDRAKKTEFHEDGYYSWGFWISQWKDQYGSLLDYTPFDRFSMREANKLPHGATVHKIGVFVGEQDNYHSQWGEDLGIFRKNANGTYTCVATAFHPPWGIGQIETVNGWDWCPLSVPYVVPNDDNSYYISKGVLDLRGQRKVFGVSNASQGAPYLQINENPAVGTAYATSGTSTGYSPVLGAEITFESKSDLQVSQGFKALSVADTTFIVNRSVVPGMAADTSTSRDKEALVFVKVPNYNTTYNLTITYGDGSTSTATTKTGTGTSTNGDTSAFDLSTEDIATALKDGITAGLKTGIKVNQHGSVLWFALDKTVDNYYTGTWTVSVTDSRGNSQINVFMESVQQFTDLPIVAPHGYILKVAGTDKTSFATYYTKFVSDNAKDLGKTPEDYGLTAGAMGTGSWEEAVAPGIPYMFDADTMPHVLIHNADNTFTFKNAEWDNRICGDETSSPNPSFIGRAINEVFFWRNRIGYCADTNVIMSRPSDFFNFFLKTATTTTDADPIDIQASSEAVDTILHAIGLPDQLILLSDQAHFTLPVPSDGVLSPQSSGAPAQLSRFPGSAKVKPVSTGDSIFFGVDREQYSGIREYRVTGQAPVRGSTETTDAVPRFLSKGLLKMAAEPNEGLLFVASSDAMNSLYVYKYYWSGDQKVQSGWSTWTLPAAKNILNIEVIDSALYALVGYGDSVSLEMLYCQPSHVDAGAKYEYSLDRKTTESHCSLEYADGLTKITLPYTALIPEGVDGFKYLVVSREPEATPSVSYPVVAYGSNWIQIKGDHRATKFFVGYPYRSYYTFSKQLLRTSDGSGGKMPVMGGRLQMRKWTLCYGKTSYFRVIVTAAYRDPSVYEFNGRVIGQNTNVIGKVPVLAGEFSFPVLAKNDEVDITIESDSWLPMSFISASFEAWFQARGQRV